MILIFELLFIIFSGSAAQRGLWPPRSRGFHNYAPHSVGLLDEWSARRRALYMTTQHTNIYTPGVIRTCDRSRRAAVDLHRIPSGHWNWICKELSDANMGSYYNILHDTCLFYNGTTAPSRPRPTHFGGFVISFTHSVGLFWTCDAENSTWRHTIFTTETSMSPAGFEPAFPASDRPQTHALDRAANGTGETNY
jgi:hypothetical protein